MIIGKIRVINKSSLDLTFQDTIDNFLNNNSYYENFNLNEGFYLSEINERSEVNPYICFAKEDDVEQIAEIFKSEYQGTYPYKQLENPSAIKQMIENPDFYWIIFKVQKNKVIGCIGIHLELERKHGSIHGFVVKKSYQGIINMSEISRAIIFYMVKKYYKTILVWSCEVLSSNPKVQSICRICKFSPFAFLPKKDYFFHRQESEFIYILYDNEIFFKFRSKKDPRLPINPQLQRCYLTSLKMMGLSPVLKEPGIRVPKLDQNKIDFLKNGIVKWVEYDEYNNKLVRFYFRNSSSYIQFFHNTYVNNAENVEYHIEVPEEFSLFIDLTKKYILENGLEYFEIFVSAYRDIEQAILLKSGFNAFGYLPAFKLNPISNELEDQVVYAFYKGELDITMMRLIEESNSFFQNILPKWKLEKLPQLNFQIIEDPKEIFRFMTWDNMIPAHWEGFPNVINFDLKYFGAKSFIIFKHSQILGHLLIFNDNSKILYFGHVFASSKANLEYLVEKLLEYAKENGYQNIKGPINIPTVIYGWGFMESGSDTSLFIGKPINPSFYQATFLEKDFMIHSTHDTWEGYLKINPDLFKKINLSNYEFEFCSTWEQVRKMKQIFLDLCDSNLSENSRITPDIGGVFNNYLEFISKYGEPFMFLFVKSLEDDEYIGCMNCIPNPFRKDDIGNLDSFVAFTIAVNKKHRNKGLGLYMGYKMAEMANYRNYNYISVPFDSSLFISERLCKAFGFSKSRSHIILDYNL